MTLTKPAFNLSSGTTKAVRGILMNRQLTGPLQSIAFTAWIAAITSAALPALAFAGDLNVRDYQLAIGDFNGDQKSDLLFIAKDPTRASGIMLGDSSGGPNTTLQLWPSNFLGIPWHSGNYTPVVADFNGDGQSDLLLQANASGGYSYLLYVNASTSQFDTNSVHQTIPQYCQGVYVPSTDHLIVAGNFYNNGYGIAGPVREVFLQAKSKGGNNAVLATSVVTTPFGPRAELSNCASGSPAQPAWTDGHASLQWNAVQAKVHAGDFNGDGYDDLFVHAKPDWLIIDYDVPFPVPKYRSLSNAIVLAYSTGGFYASATRWNRKEGAIDWSSSAVNTIVGDFDGDGRADVALQSRRTGGTNYWFQGSAVGTIAASAPSAGTPQFGTGDGYIVFAASFSGSMARGYYQQALQPGSTANGYASSILSAPTSHDLQPAYSLPPSGATTVGRTEGSFSVTPTGAAAYTIPLWTPPGAAGIQPRLALTYNSNARGGLLGPGWSVAGLSSITRCVKTVAQDGTAGPVKLATNDAYCLDGNRLRLMSGAYGADGSVYGLEVETFAKTVARNSAGNGPQSFEVWQRNGLIFEYGNTADSRQTPPGTSTVFSWHLNKIRDRVGNNLVITYTNANGAVRPDAIHYTQVPAKSTVYSYKVVFNYATTSTADTEVGYVGGLQVSQVGLLTSIEMRSGIAPVRTYRFGYSASPTTARSRLTSVQECGGVNASDCLSPTTISYQNGAAGVLASGTSFSAPNTSVRAAADINGDGRDDLVVEQYSSNITFGVAFSTGNSMGPITSLATMLDTDKPLLVEDFDADGRLDLLGVAGSAWTVVRWNGSSFVSASTSLAFSASTYGATAFGKVAAADANGDGRADLVGYHADGYVYTRLNTGSGSSVSFSSALNQGAYLPVAAPETGYIFGNKSSTVTSSPRIDFNGDGLDDVSVYVQTPGLGRTAALVSNGAAYVVDSVSGTWVSVNDSFVAFANWNDDNCTDLLFQYSIMIMGCNGATPTTIAAQTQSPDYGVVVLDWDGDSRIDLLAIEPTVGGIRLAQSTGAGITTWSVPGIALGAIEAIVIGDFNGDGLDDLIRSADLTQWALHPHDGANAPPDLVTDVTDGFGVHYAPTYRSMSHAGACYVRDSAAPAAPKRAWLGAR
jgi:hypothetical protein